MTAMQYTTPKSNLGSSLLYTLGNFNLQLTTNSFLKNELRMKMEGNCLSSQFQIIV